MTANVKPVPEGFHTATPYLVVGDAARALDFYTSVFRATELMRMAAPGGKIAHAEIRVGESVIMLEDENPQMGSRSPQTIGGSPVSLYLYVEDVDAVFRRAIAAGASEERPVQDQFYGDRCGTIKDPFGHIWHIATHKEDLSPEEIGKRAAALFDR